jgi:hypothetical protein
MRRRPPLLVQRSFQGRFLQSPKPLCSRSIPPFVPAISSSSMSTRPFRHAAAPAPAAGALYCHTCGRIICKLMYIQVVLSSCSNRSSRNSLEATVIFSLCVKLPLFTSSSQRKRFKFPMSLFSNMIPCKSAHQFKTFPSEPPVIITNPVTNPI